VTDKHPRWDVFERLSGSENHRGYAIVEDGVTIAEVYPGDEDGEVGGLRAALMARAPEMVQELEVEVAKLRREEEIRYKHRQSLDRQLIETRAQRDELLEALRFYASEEAVAFDGDGNSYFPVIDDDENGSFGARARAAITKVMGKEQSGT
jgi:hypothetical protein